MVTRGINVLQTTGQIVFRESLKDSSGAKVTTGTTELRVYRLEDDGTLDVYDWTTNDFVAAGAGTPDDETTMTHQVRRDSGGSDVATGIWTAVLSTLTNFVAGQVYIAQITNTAASPESIERVFQFGDVEGEAFELGQIAATDALNVYGASVEVNSETRFTNVDQAIAALQAALTAFQNNAENSLFLHSSTITAVSGNVGQTTTITVADPMSNAATAESGRLVLIVPQAGSPYVRVSNVTTWQLSGDVVTLEPTNGANPNVGDAVYFLPASATTGLDAAAVRAAMGLAAANLDTQLAAIASGAGGDVDGFTSAEALRLMLAVLCGKLTESGNAVSFRAADDSKTRVTANVLGNGDRTSVTLDATP